MKPHEDLMRRALELAGLQHGRTGKNPSVGCVIAGPDGLVLAEAATGDGGRPHAEQLALASLPEGSASGATAYVTLEPCHTRSTPEPSCSERLISAGVKHVFIAVRDEHPQGRGGLDRLQAADISVNTGILGEEAAQLYRDFFSSVE